MTKDRQVDELRPVLEGILQRVSAVERAVGANQLPTPNKKAPVLMDYREASTYLSLKVGTLYSLVSTKQIPFIRLGGRLVRFRKRDLDRWLEERTYSAI